MARKQISEALFKKIVEGLEKLGISLSEVLGTRTGVTKVGKSLTTGDVSRIGIQTEFERGGVDKILQLFKEDARYLHQMNELEGTKFLDNINTANKVINPAPVPEAGIFSLKEGKKLTPEEFTDKRAADRAKIDSATLKAAMETSKVDRDLAKKLNLDMSKASDFDKLQAWKKQHNLPDWGGEQGLGSLFKTRKQNELADLGTQLEGLEAEGKSLAEQAQKLVDMAWKMSPEGQAVEELNRKALLKRMNEGKGFAGGVFGARNDGFFRAVVRPFLLDQHAKGKIKLADNTLESLKNSDDLKGGGDFFSADPVRVFRQHYGDDAFDLIPDQEAFGGGQWGPTSQERIDVLEKVIGKPVLKVGPDNPGGYLTKGEYQAKLDYEDETIRIIKEGEGRFGAMSPEEIAAEVADIKARKDSIMMAFKMDHPTANFQKKDFRTQKEWQQAEIDAQAAENLEKRLEGTGVTPEGFVDPGGPEVSGIDDKLKSDFEVISGESKKGKEIAEKLGITAKPGFPVTEAGKADLKSVVTKEGFVDPFPGSKATTPMKPTKLSLNIRLMKNFDQPLEDIGLAKEGYNVQEIDVLKKARNRMTTGEEMHPNEALLREKEFLADEAGIDLDDLDELGLDIDWGDMTPEPMAFGGGVGSMFRRV